MQERTIVRRTRGERTAAIAPPSSLLSTLLNKYDAKTDTTPAYTGVCRISQQPVTNLALICRFLTGPELMACLVTSKQLSAGDTHPLTFQHRIAYTVDPLSGVHIAGPTGRFTRPPVLAQAIGSPLFRNFRLLELRAPPAPLGEKLRPFDGVKQMDAFL